MASLTDREYEACKARGDQLLLGPRAQTVRYDAVLDHVVIGLTTGAERAFPRADIQGLEHGTQDDLSVITIEAHGLGIRFPRLDADLWVQGLLDGVLGSERWMTALEKAARARD